MLMSTYVLCVDTAFLVILDFLCLSASTAPPNMAKIVKACAPTRARIQKFCLGLPFTKLIRPIVIAAVVATRP